MSMCREHEIAFKCWWRTLRYAIEPALARFVAQQKAVQQSISAGTTRVALMNRASKRQSSDQGTLTRDVIPPGLVFFSWGEFVHSIASLTVSVFLAGQRRVWKTAEAYLTDPKYAKKIFLRPYRAGALQIILSHCICRSPAFVHILVRAKRDQLATFSLRQQRIWASLSLPMWTGENYLVDMPIHHIHPHMKKITITSCFKLEPDRKSPKCVVEAIKCDMYLRYEISGTGAQKERKQVCLLRGHGERWTPLFNRRSLFVHIGINILIVGFSFTDT